DAFTTNPDRTPHNPNLLIWQRRPWLIDHGAALYAHHDWASVDDARTVTGFPLIRSHVLLGASGDLAAADADCAARVSSDVVHARTVEFLALRVVTDEKLLAAHVPGVDADLLARYLRSCEAICAGDVAAGPMALAPPSERFHWLTAPRSDVLQSSPVHEGIS